MTTQAQDDFVKQWVAALRSGEYEQHRDSLCSDTGFCCIGVAAALLKGVDYTRDNPNESYDFVQAATGMNDDYGTFDDIVIEATLERRDSLVRHNDYLGENFNQIADLIESRPPGLFVE